MWYDMFLGNMGFKTPVAFVIKRQGATWAAQQPSSRARYVPGIEGGGFARGATQAALEGGKHSSRSLTVGSVASLSSLLSISLI